MTKKEIKKPLHLKRKELNVHISKELKSNLKIKVRSVVVNKGDKVKIIRGSKKGTEGKIIDVDYSKGLVYIEGVARQTSRGTEKTVGIRPSNLILTELIDSDFRKNKYGIGEK